MTGVRRLRADVYAQLPPSIHEVRGSEWAAAVLGVPQVGSFLEGPCLLDDGRLLVSDLAHGRILEVAVGGEVGVLLDYDGRPNGMALGADGSVSVADYSRGLLSLDLSQGDLTPVATSYRLEPFRGLSDLAFSSDGTLFFTDQGQSDIRHPHGRLFRLSTSGELEVLLDSLPSPNGVAVTADGATVYVAVTRANHVLRVPVRPDGAVGKVGVHVHTAGGSGGPDGLAVGPDGSLVVAQFGAGLAWVFDPIGLLKAAVVVPAGLGVTNVVFDVSGAGRLLLTEADTGTVYAVDWAQVAAI